MTTKDLQLLEQVYDKMYESTSNRILIPRRNTEERHDNLITIQQKYIQKYIQSGLDKENGPSGDIILSGTPLPSLPEGLTVGRDLMLNNATRMTTLPKRLHVKRHLFMASSSITSLPEDLVVEGSIIMIQSRITSIPAGLYFGGSLDASHSDLVSLPDNLHVKKNLILIGSKIRTLPRGLRLDGKLYLDECPNITSLPDDITFGEEVYKNGGVFLSMPRTKITRLPSSITIKNYKIIDATKSAIRELPRDIKADVVNVTNTPLGDTIRNTSVNSKKEKWPGVKLMLPL
jgi:hypothetical protein